MSRCILTPIKLYRGHVNTLISKTFARHCSKSNDKKLGNTTILLQQGCEIQELPVVVRKLGQHEFVAYIANTIVKSPEVPRLLIDKEPNTFRTVIADEVIRNIEKCLTGHGVISVVERIPENEFNTKIALKALEKILKVDTLSNLQVLENDAAFERILGCITTYCTNEEVLDALCCFKDRIDLMKSIEKLANELLIRNSDGKMTIEECCEAILRLSNCKRLDMIDKFWSGFTEREKDITADNLHIVFSILPHLKISRRTILSILERKIVSVWWQMSSDSVVCVLSAMEACKIGPFRVLQSLSRWLYTNIHAVDECNLEAIIDSFSNLLYSDSQIEKSLERYMKAKGVKIKNQTLMVATMRHSQIFRLRNPHILNACSEYLISNHKNIDPNNLKAFFTPFGIMDYQPLNSMKFWQTLELFLEAKFIKIHPNDIIEIMLSCVYLDKYPLNFINRIFNPYFLDALHTKARPEMLPKIRSDLKLFDTALTLECTAYDGPLLPKDHSSKAIWVDGRIKRIVNMISDEIADVAGGHNRFTKFTSLPNLPVNDLYIIDVLLHPPGMGNIFTFNANRERNINVAMLVHLPEHFNSTGEYLNGPQNMRIRHLRRLGMKVVTLNYETLQKLKIHPKELNKYLIDRMRNALNSLPTLKKRN